MVVGLKLDHLKYYVVEPALQTIDMMSTSALNLVTGIALAESNASDLVQILNNGKRGPANGIFQMEEATLKDCIDNFLAFNPSIQTKVMSLCAPGIPIPFDQLIWNLKLASAFARIKVFRAPPALPAYNDAAGMAAYHKTWYNTTLGAADASNNVSLFTAAIAA